MKKLTLIISLFLITISTTFSIARINYMISASEKAKKNEYYLDVLKLALDKSRDKYGDYELIGHGGDRVQSRVIEAVKRGTKVDIMWTMTSASRERELLPIRIPLFKGLLGYRIFIIRKNDNDRFDEIESFDELRKLSAGQGHDWPDTEILRLAGMNVDTAPEYKYIFKMLTGKRFDYFPRGVNEPWKEIENFEKGELAVEKTILLQYPAPIYFFVNKNKSGLASRVTYGLTKAIEDGSFNRLLFTHEQNVNIFEQVNFSERKIFKIENPLLSQASKEVLKNENYWYKPGEEKKYK